MESAAVARMTVRRRSMLCRRHSREKIKRIIVRILRTVSSEESVDTLYISSEGNA